MVNRGKSQQAATAPSDAIQEPKGVKGTTGKRVSRETRQLMRSNFNDTIPDIISPQMATGKAGGRSPALNPKASPPKARRKNAVSAPPLPEHGGQPAIQDNPTIQLASTAADGNAARKKRAASAADAHAVAEVHEEHEVRRQKKAKSAELQQQVPRSGSGGGAGASGSLGHDAVDPNPATAVLGNSIDADMGMQPRGGKRNGKAPRASAEQREAGGSAPGGSIQAADHDAARQPAAISGKSKKSWAGVEQVAAIVSLPDDRVLSNAAVGKEQGAEQPRAVSQQATKAPTRQAADPIANAAAATAMPAADPTRPLVAAAAALPLEPLRARQEGAAAARMQQAPSSPSGGAAGPGPSSAQEPTQGPAARPPPPPPPRAAAATGDIADGRQLPPTGTTPLKPFVLTHLPRLDEMGQRDRSAVVTLQRMLGEMSALYDDVKATKIQELDKVLAEQEEHVSVLVREAEHRANLWKAAAEHAEQRAKAAESKEMEDHIHDLELQIEELLRKNAKLQFEKAQLQLELALSQQDCHNARAKLMQYEAAQGAGVHPDDGDNKGGAEDSEQEDACVEVGSGHDQDPDEAQPRSGEATHEENLPDVTLGCGLSPGLGVMASVGGGGVSGSVHRSLNRAVGLQFPTPSPGAGVHYPSPSVQLHQKGPLSMPSGSGYRSGRRGIGTECQLVVNMLPNLRTPSPSTQLNLGQGGAPSSSQAGITTSCGRGISTECLRIVQMLPGLRAPTPSVQSCFASGSAPLASQADAAVPAGGDTSGVTPLAANGAEQQTIAQESSKRRSAGSPIDGICQVGDGNMPADLSHGPEALKLAVKEQDPYSFIDLNPASCRKLARAGNAAAAGPPAPVAAHAVIFPGDPGDASKEGREQQAGATPDMAAMLAVAAATALPPSPMASMRGAIAHWSTSVNGCMLPSTGHPIVHGMTSPTRSAAAHPGGQVHAAHQSGYLRDASPDAAAMAAAAVIHSGSVLSNQGSCNVPGFVSRAMAQQQEAPRGLDMPASARPPQAPDAKLPVSASKPLATSAEQVVAADGPGDAATQAQGPGGLPLVERKPQEAVQRPSPRTAQVTFYEGVLGWKMEPLPSMTGEACRITHMASGMSFKLFETELDDEEAEYMSGKDQLQEGMGARPVTRYFEYTPINLGTCGEHLMPYLKAPITIREDQRAALLQIIQEAVGTASAKAKKP